jgi:hypothetical protein
VPALDGLEQRALLSGPGSYSADFDGSGYTDSLTIKVGGISIYHPQTGKSSWYPISGAFAINTVADTDGRPGQEVVVVLPPSRSSTGGISVIHDRDRTTSYYPISGDFAISKVADTAGQPGQEIVVVHGPWTTVITDRTKSMRNQHA